MTGSKQGLSSDDRSTESEASPSCSRFERVFGATPHPAVIIGRTDEIVAVNAALTALLGYTHSDLPTLERCFELFFPDVNYRHTIRQEWHAASMQSERGEPQAWPIATRVRSKEGRDYFVEARSSVAAGETIVTLTDVSARVHAEAAQRKALSERDELLRQLQLQSERLPVGLVVVDATEDLTLRGWNPAAEHIFGFTAGELINAPLRAVVPPPELRARLGVSEAMLNETTRALSAHTTKDGRSIQCEWFITVLADLMGKPSRIMAMVQDVTQRLQAEHRNQIWAHVLEHSPEGIFVADADERILMVNTAFQQLTGFSAEEAVGKTPRILSSGRQSRAFYAELWKTLKSHGRWQGEIWNRRKSGELYAEWLSISAVYAEDGSVARYVGIFSDITERKAAEERVTHLAQYDTLTNLPNRNLLVDRLAQALKAAARNQRSVACIFVDLDHFKVVNDSFGHDIGDELLQTVAQRLSGAVRAEDTVARMGGDEFVVVLPDLLNARDAATVANKLLEALVPCLNLEGHDVTVTASLGIALYPDDASDARALLRNADAAMYEAKSAGRNAYRFYTADMNRRALEALSVENALRRAIARTEFELHYQPQFDIASGALIGAEALIRWRDPSKGLVSPGVFIPIAEERGLITVIGEWVIAEAIRQLTLWSKTPLRTLSIAVNLSAIQFHQKDFAERVALAIAESHIDPALLELELTESIIMRDADATIGVLARLHALGLRLSIDDFGTGYSSLNYLRHFPIDKIKIDQSFVREIADDGDTASIVRGIIGLAKSLKLKVVAEGVETEPQLALLREHGCHQAQGYLFSRPLPVAAFDEFARNLLMD